MVAKLIIFIHHLIRIKQPYSNTKEQCKYKNLNMSILRSKWLWKNTQKREENFAILLGAGTENVWTSSEYETENLCLPMLCVPGPTHQNTHNSNEDETQPRSGFLETQSLKGFSSRFIPNSGETLNQLSPPWHVAQGDIPQTHSAQGKELFKTYKGWGKESPELTKFSLRKIEGMARLIMCHPYGCIDKRTLAKCKNCHNTHAEVWWWQCVKCVWEQGCCFYSFNWTAEECVLL